MSYKASAHNIGVCLIKGIMLEVSKWKYYVAASGVAGKDPAVQNTEWQRLRSHDLSSEVFNWNFSGISLFLCSKLAGHTPGSLPPPTCLVLLPQTLQCLMASPYLLKTSQTRLLPALFLLFLLS